MSTSRDYVNYLLELLAPIGEVSARRMFGGYGIFIEGLMFGLVINDELFLKADDESRAAFESRDLAPFTYMSKGKPVSLSYYHAPEEALDDSEILCEWAREAIAAAVRGRK